MILYKESSFSIAEMAIVLTIIGVIMSGAISVGLYQSDHLKERHTLQKMELIENAISAFVLKYKRLPCPANITMDMRNPSIAYSQENFSGNNCVGHSIRTNFSVGAIPAKNLLLPDSAMLDGWGNKFTFIVSKVMASKDTASNFDSVLPNHIPVREGNENMPATNGTIVYSIISHNSKGIGSYSRSGVLSTVPAGVDYDYKRNNSPSNNANFMSLGYISSNHLQKNLGNNEITDDIVMFKTIEDIMVDIGVTIAGGACNQAYNIINSFNNNTLNLCNVGSVDCIPNLLMLANIVKERCIPR